MRQMLVLMARDWRSAEPSDKTQVDEKIPCGKGKENVTKNDGLEEKGRQDKERQRRTWLRALFTSSADDCDQNEYLITRRPSCLSDPSAGACWLPEEGITEKWQVPGYRWK